MGLIKQQLVEIAQAFGDAGSDLTARPYDAKTIAAPVGAALAKLNAMMPSCEALSAEWRAEANGHPICPSCGGLIDTTEFALRCNACAGVRQ